MIVKPGLFNKPRSATLISLSIFAGMMSILHSLGRDPAVLDNASVEQMDGAIGVLREPLVVRDHANGRATGVQFLEQIHHRFAVSRIEVSSRLVREQDRRLAGERARDPPAPLPT